MLQIEGLACFRAERLVFSGLSFRVQPGQAVLVAGPNGAGKSSLLRVLAGLLRPAAGRVLWAGEDALADRADHARRVAYLGHLEAIKPALSVAGNLRLAAGRVAAGRAPGAAALAAMGLEGLEDVPARLLSAGQRRRLALARLTLAPGRLWLLDEPTLGLDAVAVERLGGLALAHLEGGGMIIAATHLPLPLPQAETVRLG